MAREDPHFRLRIPESLKKQVEEAASLNRRSMTAEIVDRLERSFRQEIEGSDPVSKTTLTELARMFTELAQAADIKFQGQAKITGADYRDLIKEQLNAEMEEDLGSDKGDKTK